MYARVTRFRGSAETIDEGLRVFREQALPWFREATGFRGFIALLDRENEQSIGITFWEDAETMRDGTTSGAALRDEIATATGATQAAIEYFEVAVVDGLALDELAEGHA